MYISDVNRKTQEKLKKFCERNDLYFEIWERQDATDLATFFFHSDNRLWIVANRGLLTIYCSNNDSDDWVFVDTSDYYQLTW